MNNFTKSILYSGVVLTAGLVAIFAIYNNLSTTGGTGDFASIEPAAGSEAGEGIAAGVTGFASSVTQAAGSAAETVSGAADQAATFAAETGIDANEAVSGAIDTAKGAASDIQSKVEGFAAPTANAPTTSEAVQAATDAAEDAATEEATQAATDAAKVVSTTEPAAGDELINKAKGLLE